MFIFPSVEIIHNKSLTVKLWKGTKSLLSGFLCFILMGLSHKSNAFSEHQHGKNKITLASLGQYCSMSEFRITPTVAKVTYLTIHIHTDTHTHTHKYRKQSLWQVYDALKLPNINISNCPFVCYSRRFLHAEAMHHSKMTESYAFVLFLELRCIDLV